MSRPWVIRGAYAAVLLGVACFYAYGRIYTHYDVDESGWIRASLNMAKLLQDGNLRPSAWEVERDWSYGNLNPPLGKLFFAGAALAAWPLRGEPLPEPPNVFNARLSHQENIKKGRVAPDDVREPLRSVGVLLGVAVVAVYMVILRCVVNDVAALVGGVLLGLNPCMVPLSNQVMTDVPYMLAFAVTLLAGLWAADSTTWRQARDRFLALCLAAAAASAVKFAAVFVLTPFVCGVALLLWWRGVVRWWAPPLMVLESLVVFAVVGVAVNPYFWPDHHDVSWPQLRAEWRLVAQGHYKVPEGEAAPAWLTSLRGEVEEDGEGQLSEAALRQLRTRLWGRMTEPLAMHTLAHPFQVTPGLYGVTRPLHLPLMYFRWYEFKRRYNEGNLLPTPKPEFFVQKVWNSGGPFPLEILPALGGLLALAGMAMEGKPRQRADRALVLLMYVAFVAVVVFFTRFSDSERYLVPVYLARSVLAAALVGVAAEWALAIRPSASRATLPVGEPPGQ